MFVHEKRIEQTQLRERVTSLSDREVKLADELQQVKDDLQGFLSKEQDYKDQLDSIQNNEGNVTRDKDTSTEDRNSTQVVLSEVRATYQNTCENLNNLRSEKDQTISERDTITTQSQEVELKLAQEKASFEHHNNVSVERYQQEATPLGEDAEIDIEKLPLFTGQLKASWEDLSRDDREGHLEEHLTGVRKKVDRYGEVNLTAINEFEEVQKRFEFLNTQKEDLETAVKTLEEAIRENTMRPPRISLQKPSMV